MPRFLRSVRAALHLAQTIIQRFLKGSQMTNWKLILEYEGARYRGWQEQANARTVQGELRKAAEDFLEEEVEIGGAGRTDAGVHALFQTVHLKSSRSISETVLRHAINDRLPPDINVLKAERVSARFHARHDAVERFYLYQIAVRRTAFGKPYVWWIKDRLDFSMMKQAAKHFTSLRDFSAYRELDKNSGESSRVHITRVELAEAGDLILLRMGASHFLWKMVRRIVGVIAEAGRGNLAPHDVPGLCHADIARLTAPPSGLFLEYVRYDGDAPPGPVCPAFSSHTYLYSRRA
jgi:tRNA pseudouridine38-40 synthase